MRNPKALIEYSNDIKHVYPNIDYQNLKKKRKIFIGLDDIISDMLNDKRLEPIVTVLLFLC